MANGEQRIILVTGATGHQGGAVARHLLEKGDARVRAITRNPDKPSARALADDGAEVIAGDLDDRGSLDAALENAYGAFSVQNFWETGYQREVDQGIRFADAAKDAGVEHFVYSSVASAHRNTGLPHFESKWKIENHIREIGLPYTIFRPVFFMENWENPMLADQILGGTLPLPLSPQRHFQQISVEDIGAFAAKAFGDRHAWLGRELDLAGDERSVVELASAFGRATGREIDYAPIPWDAYREAAGQEYYDMMRWFEDVGYDADIPTLRRIRSDLTDFERYLRETWAPTVEARRERR